MKKLTKETIRQSYSIKISKVLYTLYGNTDAYFNEFQQALIKINKIAKTTKRNDLEFQLQEFLLNTTREYDTYLSTLSNNRR
jgi:hypothetical protein